MDDDVAFDRWMASYQRKTQPPAGGGKGRKISNQQYEARFALQVGGDEEE